MPDYYSADGAGLHRLNEENRDKADLDRALFGWSKPRNTVMLAGSPTEAIRSGEIEALLAEVDAMPADDAGEAAGSHPAPAPVSDTGDDDRPPMGTPVASAESRPDSDDELAEIVKLAESGELHLPAEPRPGMPMLDPHPVQNIIEDYKRKQHDRAARKRQAAADRKRERDRHRAAAKREAERQARAEAMNADAARSAAIRDRIKAEADRRLAALLAATSAAKLDKRLAKIKGAERNYVTLWIAATAAGVNHAGKPSLSDIAAIASRRFPCDRYKVRRMLKVIEGLEASGVWAPFSAT
ncbi:hypothetical protein EDC22_102357 [Tepidamorphus gemmatus]|uniref:Uncharacterized protein n=1 Tax=Tepidamorphus gemmatus TaxID=747076 RepID=A0A4R3MJD9_9HYPH|nr:hypothetical protein [Tepidamorphus gemmatus]TCT12672.1 hypothetical protein EDC22_102357 [Tepidamorphus gemmatus]